MGWSVGALCLVGLAKCDDSVIVGGSGNGCGDGYLAIGSVPACRAAMDLYGLKGEEYVGDETESSWPKGCYVCDDVTGCMDGVWFEEPSV